MNLNNYDGKCIQVTTKNNEVFEGICYHNSADYTFHEFGRDIESIQLVNLLIYEDDIKKIISLENHKGPYGRFSKAYDYFECMMVDGGIDTIEEVLDSEEDEHIYRLLICIADYLKNNKKIKDYTRVLEKLKEVKKYSTNKKIVDEIDKIFKVYVKEDI